jgi:hypothetical protein
MSSTGQAGPGSVLPVFAVVGRVNRGKSSIIATLAEEDSIAISPLPGTTRHSTTYDVALDGEALFRLVDTPGFEDAARALGWMQRTNPSSEQRRARVAEFLKTFAGTQEFVEECELLGPVLKGAAILYVVDGSTPFRENIMAEVEILRWTGQPRMALVNRSAGARPGETGPRETGPRETGPRETGPRETGPRETGPGETGPRKTGQTAPAQIDPDTIATWHAALAPAFSTVRNFDAHAASFRERLQLLSLFRELVEPWRAPLGRAVERLTNEQARRCRESALAIASLLVDGVTHTIEIDAGPGGPSPAEQKAVEQRFLDDLRKREERSRRHVEELYRHHRVTTQAVPLDRPEFSRDLFSERVWSSLGLSASQLIAAYSIAGATAGGALDAVVGGAAFFTGTVLGAAIGGATALWQLGARALSITAVESVGERLRKTAEPTKRYRIGPHQHPNFPFVLLDRALLHHEAIRYRAHARNATEELDLGGTLSQTRELPLATRQRMSKLFTRWRKSPSGDHTSTRQELATLIKDILRARDEAR